MKDAVAKVGGDARAECLRGGGGVAVAAAAAVAGALAVVAAIEGGQNHGGGVVAVAAVVVVAAACSSASAWRAPGAVPGASGARRRTLRNRSSVATPSIGRHHYTWFRTTDASREAWAAAGACPSCCLCWTPSESHRTTGAAAVARNGDADLRARRVRHHAKVPHGRVVREPPHTVVVVSAS